MKNWTFAVFLFLISMPAVAQALRGDCGNPDPDISIAACSRKIERDSADLQAGSGMLQAAAARLATDYNMRGVAYANKGLYDEAIADYGQAISLSPKNFAMAYFNRGSAYSNQGLDDQAIADFTKAIALEPESTDPEFKLAMPMTIAATPMNAKVSTTRRSPISPGRLRSIPGWCAPMRRAVMFTCVKRSMTWPSPTSAR